MVVVFTSTQDIEGYPLMPDEAVRTSHEIAVLSTDDASALKPEGTEGEKLKIIIRPINH